MFDHAADERSPSSLPADGELTDDRPAVRAADEVAGGREPTDDRGARRDAPTRRDVLKATAGVSVVAGLAGCSTYVTGASGSGSGTTVQMTGSSAEAQNVDKINKALHDSGMPQDITVRIIAQTGSGTAQQQYTQWLSAGLSQPSLLRVDSGWTIPFILRDQLANLSEEIPEVAKNVKENYFEPTVKTATGPNGDLFGVPMFTDAGLTLYRKDLVKEAGFDPSGWATEPLSWKRFSEVAKKTSDKTNTQYGYTTQAALFVGLACCNFNEWMASMGGSYFGALENLLGDVGDRPVTVDSQPVIDAIKMVRTFIHGPDGKNTLSEISGPIAPNSVLQWQYAASLSAFTDGKAVMHRNWPFSVLAAGAEDALGKDLGVMPMPYGVRPEEAKFEGMGGSASALGGWHVALNPNAKHHDAALEVLKAMNSDKFYLSMLEVTGYIPPKPNLLETDKAKNTDVVGRYVDTLKFAGEHAVPRPVSVAWPMESPRISQEVSAGLRGTATPKNAMSTLQNTLERIEKRIAQEGS